jgi:hypothetical protein
VEAVVEVCTGFTTTTPLFHISFFPDFMQVKVLFWETIFWFKTLQALPGVTFSVATAELGISAIPKAIRTPLARTLLIRIPQ